MSFLTIRQTAAIGIISEHFLRLLVKQGRCPGLQVGNRFLVNVEQLSQQLERESRAAVRQEVGHE